jgi:hypothetical protein
MFNQVSGENPAQAPFADMFQVVEDVLTHNVNAAFLSPTTALGIAIYAQSTNSMLTEKSHKVPVTTGEVNHQSLICQEEGQVEALDSTLVLRCSTDIV